jgi:hypothetical protein
MQMRFVWHPEAICWGWESPAAPFVQMIPTPFNAGLVVLLALWILGSLAVFFVIRQRLPRKLRRFEGRERLSVKQIHDRFYPSCEMGTFVELWSEIASGAEVPPELMRPTDRFDKELGPVKGFKVAGELEDLEESLLRRCKEHQLDFHNVKAETVDDYIRLFTHA